jgi:predicted CXXCH cytochrome family protein
VWPSPTPGFNGATSPVNTAGLACSDCHSAHGSANYRNMKSSTRSTSAFYNKLVTYEIGGTPSNAKDVYEAAARGYGWNNVNYQEPDQTKSAYGAWCMSCHTTFHGSPADANIETGGSVIRHPTAGVDLSSGNLTQLNLHTNKVKLMDGLGKWDGTTATMTHLVRGQHHDRPQHAGDARRHHRAGRRRGVSGPVPSVPHAGKLPGGQSGRHQPLSPASSVSFRPAPNPGAGRTS